MKTKLLSFIMAIVLLVTFAVPAHAYDMEPLQDVVDMTGGYQDSTSEPDAAVPDIAPPRMKASPMKTARPQ